ncbi:hypothetical protein BP6252_04095 [Coleophoma cylindrospora]|uniref:AAA+ ATPase domain-containing protein n=1 Tax=Coleophoma cylindrospora TaxID=1849047 RepID=A0A3D8RZH2_9HELO|nr:hypothetical protein BP6252_04095 [Coleophoma cylindrospora]
MKLKIHDRFAEGATGTNEANESYENGVEDVPKKKLVLKCEVKEHETRYSLKGPPVMKVIEAGGENDDDEEKDCVMNSYKQFDQLGSLLSFRVEVYSPHINEALRVVIKKYPTVSFHGDTTILYGLHCIFHYRHELESYRQEVRGGVPKLHLHLLLRFMRRELQREIKAYQANVETAILSPSIEFKDLWMLFRPGELVVHGRDQKEQLSMLVSMQLVGEKTDCCHWSVVTKIFTHDGNHFGYTKRTVKVQPFEGASDVRKLNIYPLKYHQNEEQLREKHAARGRKFCSLKGVHHQSYKGIATALGRELDRDSYGQVNAYPLETKMVNSRIIVDAKTFGVFKSPNRVQLDERKPVSLDADNGLPVITTEDYMICDFQIPGFSLFDKTWCWFAVEIIEPVEFNSDAFGTLLLPPKQKKLLHALVKSHGSDDFDDMIKGKGKGLVFVLHGEPGVGKTFTAESIADHVQRPLYILNSGDLGVSPESVEENLTSALALATFWGAIVLIDEADVFLEQRTIHDLTRNCLVSLFLRILEYYEGILFLTTNRLTTFDVAFKSRIHLALKYSALDQDRRKELWKLFLDRTSQQNVESWPEEVLESLSKVELNGRQIKNAVRTAITLAKSEETSITESHLETVLETLKDFEDELKGADRDVRNIDSNEHV